MMPRGLLTLLSGNGLAQLITLLAVPLPGRVYDPVAFGQLAAVMAIVSLTTVLVHGRYHLAIPVAGSEDEARSLLWLATIGSLTLSLPAVLLVYALVGEVPEGLTFWPLILVAAGMSFLSALIDILAYWRSYRERFDVSARLSVVRSASTVVGQVLLSFTHALGLLIGTVVGTFIAACGALLEIMRWDREALKVPKISHLNSVARKFYSYPVYGVPQGWLAAFSWNAMPLLLLRFGGTALAGQYWIAYRLLVAPVSLFNGAYRQATLPVLRKMDGPERWALARKHTTFIAFATIVPFALLFWVGDQLFALLIGNQWALAGMIAGWLGIGVFADLFKIPTLCLLQSQNLQRRLLIWEAIIVVVRYSVAIWFLINDQALHAIAVFAGVGFIGWLLACFVELVLRTHNDAPGTED